MWGILFCIFFFLILVLRERPAKLEPYDPEETDRLIAEIENQTHEKIIDMHLDDLNITLSRDKKGSTD